MATQTDIYALRAKIAAFEAGVALAELEIKGGPGSGPPPAKGPGRGGGLPPQFQSKRDSGRAETDKTAPVPTKRGGKPPVDNPDEPGDDEEYKRTLATIELKFKRAMEDAARSQDAGAVRRATGLRERAMAEAAAKRDQKQKVEK